MSAAVLGAVAIAGLAAGRLSALVVDRYRPRRPGHGERDLVRCRLAGRHQRRSVAGAPCRRAVPVVELVTAAAWPAVVHRFGLGWAALPPLVAATALVALSVIDLRVYRLPDAVTLPALAASLAAVVAASVALGRPGAIVPAAAVAAGYGAVMWVAHEIQPRGLGFGDVKIAPLLGLHIGWVAGILHSGWRPVVSLALQALLMSCLAGIATGVALAMLRRRGYRALDDPAHSGDPATRARLRDTSFPFGPALAAGTMVAVLFSEALIT